MAGKKKLTADSYIRNLPYSAMRYMAMHLDNDDKWKDFVVFIPKRLDSSGEFQERYTNLQIKTFEDRGRKPSCSPTLLVLNDWGTQNAQLRHLYQVFNEAKLYVVADYLLEQTGQEKVCRDDDSFSSKSTSTFTDSTTSSNMSDMETTHKNDHDRKKDMYKSKAIEKDFAQPVNVEQIVRNGSIQEFKDSFTSEPSAELEAGNDISQAACNIENLRISSPCKSQTSQNKMNDFIQANMSKSENKMCSKFTPRECLCSSSQEMNYNMLCSFTKNFMEVDVSKGGNMIGCGGFGIVFVAKAPDGCKAAVKQLRHPEDPLMEKQFKTELEKLSKFRHENIVSLLGYSVNGPKKCLVYAYMPNGSLEERLSCYRNTEPLAWKRRLEIVRGTARGIVFLNKQGEVHRDIKSANVLLDENFVPKVGDFATVRTGPSGNGMTMAETMQVIGTSAYMAPEAIRFDVSAKLDSFAFGIVLLEILTGLAPNDPHRDEADLWSYIQEKCEDDNDIEEILDNSGGEWDKNVANKIFVIAQRCLEDKKKKRALVAEVLPELEQLVQKCCTDSSC